MSVLAVDAGATGVTAVVVTPDGTVAARGHAELAEHAPMPGQVELVPEEIWRATLGAARAALAAYDGEVTAVGVTTQRDTVVLWDRETLGSPRAAITGRDRRAADVCARLREAGHEGRVAELTGLRLDPGLPGATLAWLAGHEPNTWALVTSGRYAVGTVDSYLVARMTLGIWHLTDVADAARTLLLDLDTGDWSDELCDLFGVPRDALPELVPTWGAVATTEPRAFAGLAVPVAAVAGDRQAALFGLAGPDEGAVLCTYGAEPSVLATTGATPVRSALGLTHTAAWRAPDGGLTYALEGTVSMPTGDAPLTRESAAVVASGVRDVVEALPGWRPGAGPVHVDGDAARDDLLCQVQADLLGVAVERPRQPGTSAALGAAYLAGLGTGLWSSPDDLRDLRQTDRFEPRG